MQLFNVFLYWYIEYLFQIYLHYYLTTKHYIYSESLAKRNNHKHDLFDYMYEFNGFRITI